jgi:uncharacterized protein YhaN
MRFRALDLERYGAFEGRRLVFREGAALHLVHGANEAGKSTALEAATEVLYGIAAQSTRAFRFAYADLRLGAEIVARDGRALVFRRRKGLKGTLIDAAEKPLPDDLLAPFLAGVDAERFRAAFGLSQESLRHGGEAMLKTGGEAAAALAGASGLGGWPGLAKVFEGQASELFKPGGKKARFNEIDVAFETERRLVRDATLNHEAWARRVTEIGELRARFDGFRERRLALGAERQRLERIKRTTPALARIAAIEAALAAAIDPGPSAPAAADLNAAMAALARAEEARERARGAFDRLARELAATQVDEKILAEADEIDALSDEIGVHLKERQDMPSRRASERAATQELAAIAARLGIADTETLLARQPDAPALARLRDVLARGERLVGASEQAKVRVTETRAARDQAEAERRRLAPAPDPAPLAARAKALAPLHDAARVATERAAEHARRVEEIATNAARLSPPIASLDALRTLVLPHRAEVEVFAEKSTEFSERERALRARLDAARAEGDAREAEMARLAATGALVDEASIHAARGRRDGAWAAARGALVEGETRDADALARRVETGLREADDLADRRFADAARASEHAVATRQRDDARRLADALSSRDLPALQAERERERESYLALWSGTGLAPIGNTKSMLAWLDAVDELRGRLAALADLGAAARTARAEVARLLPALEALEADLGLAPAAADPATRLRVAEASLEEARARWQATRERVDALARAEQEFERARREDERQAALSKEWTAEFELAVTAIGATPDAGLAGAREIVELWASTAAPRESLDNTRQRIGQMEANGRDRMERLGAIGQRLGEAPGAEFVASVRELARRLEDARAAEKTRRKLKAEQALADTERSTAEAAYEAARGALARIAAPLGTEDPAALGLVARDLAARESLLADRARTREEIASTGDGIDLATLRAEAEANPIDAARARLAVIGEEEAEIERARDETRDALAAAETALAEATSGGKAADALQRQMVAAAEMGEIARRWGVATLARALIGEALARHRARFQDPLVKRASAIFEGLTGGDWAGLGVDYDENGGGGVVAKRPDGRGVGVAGLSEGTRDQMFLALRLASLEAFAEGADPPPFLGDDLLVSFDERRAAAAFRALAETGRQAQVILFTHHRFMIDLARHALGESLDLIEL